MIDLTKRLPNAIYGADGKPFLLNTDFRYWIQFNEDLKRDSEDRDISYLFKGDVPYITNEILMQLQMFLYNPSATPKSDFSGERVLDYVLDGDYIFSALYATYGIDITEMEMHWHKFQALCNNIVGDNTLWGYAKQRRGYKKSDKSMEQIYEKEKIAWSLPVEEKEQSYEEYDEYFKDI